MPDGEEDAELPGLEELENVPPPSRVEGPSGREYGESSLVIGLAVYDEPRKRCIRLVEHPAFDAFILLVILCNCVTMAWESPLDPEGTRKADFIDVCEWYEQELSRFARMYSSFRVIVLRLRTGSTSTSSRLSCSPKSLPTDSSSPRTPT